MNNMHKIIIPLCLLTLFGVSLIFCSFYQTENIMRTDKFHTYNILLGTEYEKNGVNIAIAPNTLLCDKDSLDYYIRCQSIFYANSTNDSYNIIPFALGKEVLVQPWHDSSGTFWYTNTGYIESEVPLYTLEVTNRWVETQIITTQKFHAIPIILGGMILLATGIVSLIGLIKKTN